MVEDELLDTGPRRTIPRWLVVLGVVLVAAGAVIVAVQRNQHPSPPRQPGAASGSVTRPVPTPTPFAPGLGPLLPLGSAPVLDVVVDGDTTWALRTNEVRRDGPEGRAITTVPRGAVPADGRAQSRLLLDNATGSLWVVVAGIKHGRALEYDARTLALRRKITALGFINDADVMRGHLYAVVGDAVVDVAPQRAPRALTRFKAVGLNSITADAVRGRLLVTDYGNPTGLWSVIVPDPGTGAQLSVSDPVRLRVTKASIAIATTGQIWLGGFDTGDGVFMQLDPQTLEPVLHSPSDKKLEPGAVVVAAGYRSLWIRASGGDYLLCMDAVTGAERQAWTVSGGVASTNGRAVVGTARGVVAAHLRGCPG